MSLLVGAQLIGGTFIVTRLRATYKMQTELQILKSQHEEVVKQNEAIKTDTAIRLDELERFLFGDVVEKLQKAESKPVIAPAQLQRWMVNRDKDLRDRLDRLERWRLEHDNEVKK
jgi:hypothetical protein